MPDPNPGPLELPPLILGDGKEELDWAGAGFDPAWGCEGCAAESPPGCACFGGTCAGAGADEGGDCGADGAGCKEGDGSRAGAGCVAGEEARAGTAVLGIKLLYEVVLDTGLFSSSTYTVTSSNSNVTVAIAVAVFVTIAASVAQDDSSARLPW